MAVVAWTAGLGGAWLGRAMLVMVWLSWQDWAFLGSLRHGTSSCGMAVPAWSGLSWLGSACFGSVGHGAAVAVWMVSVSLGWVRHGCARRCMAVAAGLGKACPSKVSRGVAVVEWLGSARRRQVWLVLFRCGAVRHGRHGTLDVTEQIDSMQLTATNLCPSLAAGCQT